MKYFYARSHMHHDMAYIYTTGRNYAEFCRTNNEDIEILRTFVVIWLYYSILYNNVIIYRSERRQLNNHIIFTTWYLKITRYIPILYTRIMMMIVRSMVVVR